MKTVHFESNCGVRPSSGAAMSARAFAPKCSPAPSDSMLAAPEGGRAPAAFFRGTLITVSLFLLFTLGLFTANCAENQKTSSPQPYIIGLSPFLDKAVKDDVYRSIIHLLVEDLPLNSSLSIYDAFELKTITHVALPDARVFHSSKTRAHQFAGAIRGLKQFLAQEHSAPTNAHLN